MPSQSARTLVLLCVVMGLLGSPGLVSGDAAGDREILEHIAVQTHHDERLEGTEVHIVVRGGHVVLSGTVYLYSQKMLYEHIAGRTPGVAEINNDIRVVPRLPVEDAEIARAYPYYNQRSPALPKCRAHNRCHGGYGKPQRHVQ